MIGANVSVLKGLKYIEYRERLWKVLLGNVADDHQVTRQKEGNSNAQLSCRVECFFYSS